MTPEPTPNASSSPTLEADSYSARISVPEGQEDFDVSWPDYRPPEYTDRVVLTKGVEEGWADPEDPRSVDYSQRASYVGPIRFDEEGRPLNPTGRTGIRGRGMLGKWGPNHAADPVTVSKNAQSKAQVLLIKRKDSGEWALPGGMVDPGEKLSQTAKRELQEESGVDVEDLVATEVYSGIVDDPRNTDNAWIETAAYLIDVPVVIEPKAGEEVDDVGWFEITPELLNGLYANHGDIIRSALEFYSAEQQEKVHND